MIVVNRILPFLIVSMILLSCRAMKEPEYRSIENFRLNKIGLSQATLSLDMRYMNPNNKKIKLKKANGDVFVNDNYLGQFSMDSLIRLPRLSDFTIPVIVELDMNNFLKTSITILSNPIVTLKLNGTVRAGRGMFYMNYPFNYEGQHSVKELIDSGLFK